MSLLKQQYARASRPLCVFDVGSNKGQFLSLLVQGLRSLAIPFYAHAFEPSQRTYEILYDNFKDYPNLILNNFGLGKANGQFELFYDEIGSGLASLSKRRLDHFGIAFKCSETVTIQVLDDYCSKQGIEGIDLLKLDVEGHELDVLVGGSRMLGERRIRMVSFEFGGCNIDSRTYFQDFWYFFQENGMSSIYRIAPSSHLVPIPQYKEVYEQFRTTNFLVLQSGT
jgi:FkbM family methyltransferase